VQLSVAAGTDVGRTRVGNEDSLHADADEQRGVFIVADGMGGHAAGEIASAMAVHTVAESLSTLHDTTAEDADEQMAFALREANRRIYERTLHEPEKRGMGTTLSCLVLGQGHWLVGHIGDSRVYLLRDGALYQLTRDHSYVQEQVEAGLMTPEEARRSPHSNVITRCVGANRDVEADVVSGALHDGDRFLLASDGLTGMLDDMALQRVLHSELSPGRQVDSLIANANRRGGLDNITAIVVQVQAVASERPRHSDEPWRRTTGEHPVPSHP
jgi:protein phosphatase